MNAILAYIPKDRQKSISHNESLLEQTNGTALFADISGFTPLTAGLAKALGARRGAEELAKRINEVYDVLIDEIHAYGGSVIGFSGDAVTCWFDEVDGEVASRAVACGWALQKSMRSFNSIELPDNQVLALSLRVGIASGTARRFLVGDPNVQLIDTLVGATIDRMATAQVLCEIGGVVIDQATHTLLADKITVSAWDTTEIGRFASVVQISEGLASRIADVEYELSEEQARAWIPPPVYQRMRQGNGEFLTELRPATALFIGFDGIDYENDADASDKLNSFVTQVQATINQYEGIVIQLTIGDKGSYLYVAFGAPLAHEDDALRAVYAAHAIRETSKSLDYITDITMGITQGTMRTGAYGSQHRRTYGVLGDNVNIAARLMQYTTSGSIAGSGRIQAETSSHFEWRPQEPMKLKGKDELMPVALLGVEREYRVNVKHTNEYALPMVGRQEELTIIEDRLKKAISGEGQIIDIVAEAGMGKSRLVQAIIDLAQNYGLDNTTFFGECPSYGTTTPYLVWQSLMHQFVNLQNIAKSDVTQYLEDMIHAFAPEQVQNLPLLEAILNIGLLPNDYTSKLDAKTSSYLRHSLICSILEAQPEARIIILEDTHWIDPVSRELLETVATIIKDLPVLLVIAQRPTTEQLQLALSELPYYTAINLEVLTESETEELIRNKLTDSNSQNTTVPELLIAKVLERAQGNPFYIEEFINYLHDNNISIESAATLTEATLPSSLQSLILSRIDKLSEQQKVTLKVASIIGRIFSLKWILGYYPALGEEKNLKNDLQDLAQLDLTPLDTPEPNLTYLFKHIVTQEVTYESLSYEMRLQLHEQFAQYLEQHTDNTANLGQITYHYERSSNLAKKLHYFRLSGTEALDTYALDTALIYFDKALSIVLTQASELNLNHGDWLVIVRELYMNRSQALEYQQKHAEALANYAEMVEFAEHNNCLVTKLKAQIGAATIYGTWTSEFEPKKSIQISEQALELAQQLADRPAESKIYWNLLLAHSLGNIDPHKSIEYGQMSLAIAQELGLKEREAFALNNLGLAYVYGGEIGKAVNIMESVPALWTELGNMPMLADAYGIMLWLNMSNGNLKKTFHYANLAIEICKTIGIRWNEFTALVSSSDMQANFGHFEQALHLAQKAVGYREIPQSTREWAESVVAYGLLELGLTDLALQHADNILKQLTEAPPKQPFSFYPIITYLPLIYVSQGYLKQANQCIDIAREFIDNNNSVYNFMLLARAESDFKFVTKEYEALIDLVHSSLVTLKEADSQAFIVDFYWYLANAQLDLGQLDSAKENFMKALEKSKEIGERRLRWRILQMLHQVASQENDYASAKLWKEQLNEVILYIKQGIENPDYQASFLKRVDLLLK